ncbi:TPA: hypothetical protein DE059_02305 [Candidatus Peribacteria bacterium]|jgi:uncharacterized membrane protein|nr:hypothetical protein [Candidatus Peribacteria bacterium]|tara:strand:+ start:300 stop:587 length:288 start_codon:yes stop_codon:yes gene_type:complete
MSKPMPKSTNDKLDEIIEHLRNIDKRDRLRTIGGFFKGLISLIPIIVLLGSIWWAFKYGDQLLEKIAQQAAKQAAIVTEQQGGEVMKQFENFLVR